MKIFVMDKKDKDKYKDISLLEFAEKVLGLKLTEVQKKILRLFEAELKNKECRFVRTN